MIRINTSEKVKATEVREVEVLINESEIKRLVTSGDRDFTDLLEGLKQTFLNRSDLPKDAYLDHETGTWKQDVEDHGGSHSWTDTKILRTAKQNEKVFIESLEDMKTTLTIMKLS